MKNTISELKNTIEGIKSRLTEAEDQIRKLEDKVEKNTQQEKENKFRKNEEGLREMQDNRKVNNIHIIGYQKEKKSKGKASKPCTHGRTSSNTICPHLHNRKQEEGDRLSLK